MKPKLLVTAVMAAAVSVFAIPASAAAYTASPAKVETTASQPLQTVHYVKRRGIALGPSHNGYRGIRYYKHGYRRYNGWWYPPAAFSVRVIIGKPNYRYALPSRHVSWCDWRYKTYRAWDNTYVPKVGYRAQCVSPYWKPY